MNKLTLLLVLFLSSFALSQTQTQVDINVNTKGNLLANRLGVATFPSLTTACTGTQTWALNHLLIGDASMKTTGACTLNITNPAIGGNYVLVLTHGTGGSITLGTGCTWKVSGGGPIVQTSTGLAIDILAFTYDGTFCYANFQTNFS